MPENTVYVGRGSKWGNPFPVGKQFTIEESLKNYKVYILGHIQVKKDLDIEEIRGKNLACWCSLDEPCHADVLLKLANKENQDDKR